jgi:hypothetical protein
MMCGLDVEFGERLARRFHELYELLAPEFGYETRVESRVFDAESANGRLMIAVCSRMVEELKVNGV